MAKELILSSIVGAVWLTLVFLGFGGLHGLIGEIVGLFRLLAWENAFGTIEVWNGVTIGRLSVWVYGLAAVVSMLPVNYYWLRRIRSLERNTDADATSGR